MNNRKLIPLAACAILACTTALAARYADDFKSKGDNPAGKRGTFGDGVTITGGGSISGSRQTGEISATGGVSATSGVFQFHSDSFHRSPAGVIDFGENASMTTCTNDADHLHWRLSGTAPASWLPSGTVSYRDTVGTNETGEVLHRAVTLHDMWLYWEDLPVLWVPWWYYPLDTNYGYRFLPGYRSRWGVYALSGYIYDIWNESGTEGSSFSLGGSSYLDWRAKNGLAVGQTVRWGLGDLGHGKLKMKYAWDEDYDHYERHWNSRRHYHYANWGSPVDRERYRFAFEHSADFTERDSFRLQGDWLSDSRFRRDFFLRDERGDSVPVNEAWYEHRENDLALGASASGPLNRFYGGTARLPEAWLAIEPQPVFSLPLNYESQTRAGYLNRQFREYTGAEDIYRYYPYIGPGGRGADYQAFRADTAHRLTLPFKLFDTFSFVPRAGYRATSWSDSGDMTGEYSTKASGDSMWRGIAEAGATFSARGSAWLTDNLRHTVEPYIDYSFQRAELSGDAGHRYYAFDAYDRSIDWLDQFGFEGRGLPYSWHGVRPGIRNYFQTRDDKGYLRTLFDFDGYLAVPFSDEDYYQTGNLKGYPKNDEHGNYSRTDCVTPGFRTRFHPDKDTVIGARVEFDTDRTECSYADLSLRHRITDKLSWYASYIGRDHQIWEYLPSDVDRWNRELSNIFMVGFEHNLCDRFAWSPYIRHDCRRDECEEVGCWFDFLTDCLGYRIAVDHETSYKRMDGSKHDADTRVCFFVYLRALGPGSILDLARF